MYAVPQNMEYLISANAVYGTHKNRDILNGGTINGDVSLEPQLPSFNTVFYQKRIIPAAATTPHQRSNDLGTGTSWYRGETLHPHHPHHTTAVYNREAIDSCQYGSSSVYNTKSPYSALLPTVPAASLLMREHQTATTPNQPRLPTDKAAASLKATWPHLPLKNQIAPTCDALKLQHFHPEGRSVERLNHHYGFTPKHVGAGGRVLVHGSVSNRNSDAQNPTVGANFAKVDNQCSSISREEKEAAETLAEFCWSNNSPVIEHRQSENGRMPFHREIAMRHEQRRHAIPANSLRGDTAAETAEKILQLTQRQQEQARAEIFSTTPAPYYGRFTSDHSTGTYAVGRDQANNAVAPNLVGGRIISAEGPLKLDDVLLQNLLRSNTEFANKNHVVEQRQQHGRQSEFQNHDVRGNQYPPSLPSQSSSSVTYQRETVLKLAPPPVTSSSLFQFVNEFIRQMDQSASVVQHWAQHKLDDERRVVEQRPAHDDCRRTSFVPKVIRHDESQQSLTANLSERVPVQPNTANEAFALKDSYHPPVDYQRQQSLHLHQQTSVARLQPNPSADSYKRDTPRGSDLKAAAVDQPLVKESRIYGNPATEVSSDHLNRSDSAVPLTVTLTGTVERMVPVHRQAGRTANSKLRTVAGGKINKHSSGFSGTMKKIQNNSKQAAKIASKRNKHSVGVTSDELTLPAIKKEGGALSLSTIGLLTRLVKSSSYLARYMRKQLRQNIRGRASIYYEKLPSIFGPVAASLSVSNGATTKTLSFSLTDTAALTSLATQQPRSGGPVFTNGKKHVYAKIPVTKQEMATPVSDRIPLPDGTLESEESLKNRLENNSVQPLHKCGCLAEANEDIEGPYYTHLAAAPSVEKLRTVLEERYGERGSAIRIEKVRHTNKEGKTPDGCPIAKWVIRRSGPDEKILCVVRQRPNHFCSTAVVAIIIVIWDGVPRKQADDLYDYLVDILPKYGITTNRRCETNEKRLCACQGINQSVGGASFSFGCSWSMYSNTCKFCKSRGDAKKFKLTTEGNQQLESRLEEKCHKLADVVAPVFKRLAPACYRNQTYYSDRAQPCRLGYVPRGPFSGITACVDFCAHAHKDTHNMNNGCTVVVTLTKHRGFEKPDDEQLHVLPLCVLEPTDEFGSHDNQWKKTQSGALEILDAYPMYLRVRRKALPSCKERTKQQKQRPKAKQPRLDPNIQQRTPGAFSDLQSSSFNAANNRVDSIAPNYIGQEQSPYNEVMMEKRQVLPSVDTFSHFYRPEMSCASASGTFMCADARSDFSGLGTAYEIGNSRSSSFSQPRFTHDLARFTQGFRTTSSGSSGVRQEGCGSEEGVYVAFTDNREAFDDPCVGGVAVALSHGSVLLEVAKRELHATTALKTPNRCDPKRISLVFYQHKHLNYPNHGAEELEKKNAEKNGIKVQQTTTISSSSDDEIGDDKSPSTNKGQFVAEECWPALEPLKQSGEWRLVGAKNLCTTLITDSVNSTASSRTCQCCPTQYYVRQKSTVILGGEEKK